MRISRIESFDGRLPPVNPSIKICPPFGPTDGPANACNAAASSSGSSGSASRSLPPLIVWLALLPASVLIGVSATVTCSSIVTFSVISADCRPALMSTGCSSERVKPGAMAWS